MKKYISFPRVEGLASRQAHCDLPKGTYEREFGRDGFFGPSTHLYHDEIGRCERQSLGGDTDFPQRPYPFPLLGNLGQNGASRQQWGWGRIAVRPCG